MKRTISVALPQERTYSANGPLTETGDLVSLSTTTPVAYFEILQELSQQAAAAAGGTVERFFTIAGYTMRLRFAGPALLSCLTRALAHLAAEPTPAPALTIDIVDSASTGVRLPRPPWQADDQVERQTLLGFNNGRIRGACQVGNDYCSMLDAPRDAAVYWLSDHRKIPYWECGAPLRVILHWWMESHGYHLVHAAAVGTDTGGVLLGGKGGSGKSTTALASLNGGLSYVSDDYCLISVESPPYAYSLYSSAKLNADNVGRFPALAGLVSNADRLDSEKALLYLHEHFPERVVTGLPLRAILLPRVTGLRDTRLTAVTSAEALKVIAPSTIFQLPGSGLREFQALARLVREVPVMALEVGTDLSQIPTAIHDLLSRSQP
jgi:hypothetical protein